MYVYAHKELQSIKQSNKKMFHETEQKFFHHNLLPPPPSGPIPNKQNIHTNKS